MLQGIGRDVETVPLLRLAEKLLPKVRNQARLAIALDYSFGSLLQAIGDRDAATARLNSGLVRAIELNDRGWQSEFLNAAATSHMEAGKFPLAIEIASKQLKLAREDDNQLAAANALLTLAEAHVGIDDLSTALGYATQSRDIYDTLDDLFSKADARRELARISALLGRVNEARATLNETLKLRPEDTSTAWRYRIARVRTAIALATGDKIEARVAKAHEDARLTEKQIQLTSTQTKALREYHEVNERELQLQLMQRESEVRELAMKRDQTRIFWRRIAIAATSLLLAVAAIGALLLSRRSKTLKRAAETDALTGALSRSAILASAQTRCSQAAMYSQSVAVCVLDVDHFKHFNDAHGHATGDKILAQCVELMKKNVREGDAVGRIGGDEFLIVMDHVDEAQASATARRIIEAVRKVTFDVEGESLRASLSAGIAAFRPNAQDSAKLLVQRADTALLRAKQTGKNKVVAYGENEA